MNGIESEPEGHRGATINKEGTEMPGTHHLFAVTRWLLRLATWFSFFLIAVLALALGALELAALGLVHLPIPTEVMQEIQGMGVDQRQTLAAAGIAIAGAAICVALAACMFILTTRIIDAAGAGDPFVTENADRLNRIAWLLLAIQAVGLGFDNIIDMFPARIREHVNFGFDVSATGILAALLIFVLAQIFRRGSEMRADLEGTV
jgi:hypothetical protein